MSKPIIGITGDVVEVKDARTGGARVQLNINYAEMVARAGGVPLIITPHSDPESVASLIDGLLIPGGMDIDARHFGEENHPANELQHPERFRIEAAVYRALPGQLPILGICYGCQFVNVMQGGKLEQHTPDRVGSNEHSSGELQTYEVDSESRFAGVVGAPIVEGRSFHHQAVSVVGEGLKVVATHRDGTVEALEGTDGRFCILVQWHPERTPDDDATVRLFQSFIDGAKWYREQKYAAVS